MKLKLDLHDVYNRGQDIDRALRGIIDEAVRTKAPLVEIIPGKGSGQLKKHVLRFLEQKEIKALYHRVEKDSRTSAESSCTSAGSDQGAASTSPLLVVDRLVGGRQEVEEDRRGRPPGSALVHEDGRHVLGRVVVPDDAVSAVPSVAPDRGAEVRAPGADRHPETPAMSSK